MGLVREREIWRYLGYRGNEPGEDVRSLIEECVKELEKYAVPKSYWREFPLHIAGHVIDFGVFRTESRDLEKNLRNCQEAILFAATLGSGVDGLLRRYARLQMSKCVVLQAAAASMLEVYCDEKNEELKEDYQRKGRYLRPRFSPGYGDFTLGCQRPLADALELNKRIGITLTDSLMMAPSKSVTAVIGVSPVSQGCTVQGCEACGKEDCLYRR